MKKTILVAAITTSMFAPVSMASEQGTFEVNGKTYEYHINENGDVISGAKPVIVPPFIEDSASDLIETAIDDSVIEVTKEEACAVLDKEYKANNDVTSKVFDKVCDFPLTTEEKYQFASGYSLEVYKSVGTANSMTLLGTLNLHGHEQELDHVSKPKEYKEINRVVGYTLGGEKLHSDWSATVNYEATDAGEVAINLSHSNVRAIEPKSLSYSEHMYTVNPKKASEKSLVTLSVNEIEPIYSSNGDKYFVKLIK